MKVNKKEQVMREVVVDITCDICGKSCKKECGFEYASLESVDGWGYDSRKDGEVHEADICEECYDKIREYIEKVLKGKIRVSIY